jgi:hypothetical protein
MKRLKAKRCRRYPDLLNGGDYKKLMTSGQIFLYRYQLFQGEVRRRESDRPKDKKLWSR